MRLVAIVLALGLGLAFLEALAASPVRLEVRPAHFGFVGCDLEIRAHVERRAEPQLLAIAVDGENFYRSWIDELEPNAAPARRPSWIQHPPAGHYVITADLFRSGRRVAREYVETEILGR